MNGDLLVGIQKAVLLTPHGVSGRGAAIEFVCAVLEDKSNVDMRMLSLDPKVLCSILCL